MLTLGKLRVKRKSRYRNPDMFNITTARLMRAIVAEKLAKAGLA